MALTSSSDAVLTPTLRRQLLESAAESIKQGLCGEIFAVDLAAYDESLRARRASFVTLHVAEKLRGCIGTLEAERPLIEDVVRNARGAAFDDPRFPALTWPEFELLSIHISLLNIPEPMRFDSESDLLAQLRPHVDGLILAHGRHRGTFLPSVWETLPDSREFLRQLKQKAGLSPDYWSKDLRILRYTTESIS